MLSVIYQDYSEWKNLPGNTRWLSMESSLPSLGLWGSERLYNIYIYIIKSDIFFRDGSKTIWDYILFPRIRNKLGGNIKIAVVASAPITSEVKAFFKCALDCRVRIFRRIFLELTKTFIKNHISILGFWSVWTNGNGSCHVNRSGRLGCRSRWIPSTELPDEAHRCARDELFC